MTSGSFVCLQFEFEIASKNRLTLIFRLEAFQSVSSHNFNSRHFEMAPKNTTVKELTASDRKSIFAALLPFCQNGTLLKGSFVTVADNLGLNSRRVASVWYSVMSNIEESLCNHKSAEEGLDTMLRILDGTFPFNSIPDSVYRTGKPGTVGSKRKYDREELEERMETIPLNKRGTFRDLASGLDISHTTAFDLLKEGSIRSITSVVKPSLTEEQKLLRYHFCCDMVNLDSVQRAYTRGSGRWRYGAMFNRVFVDESWFNETDVKRRYLLTKKEKDPYRSTHHKSHINKIMYIAAVARPRYCTADKTTWNGKLHMSPIGSFKAAERSSKNRSAGTLVWKNESVDTKVYTKKMCEIVDAIVQQWPRRDFNDPNYKVIIQDDGARPHRTAYFKRHFWGHVSRIVSSGKMTTGKIVLVQQPAQSPDMNVLDLGVFNAIKSLYRKRVPRGSKGILSCVKEAWEEFPSYKLNRIFLTQMMIYNCVIENAGGNDYPLPHMSKGKWEKLGKLPTALAVSDQARKFIYLDAEVNQDPDDSSVDTEDLPTSGPPAAAVALSVDSDDSEEE